MIELETVNDAVERYIRSVQAKRAENTAQAYNKGMKVFAAFLGTCGVELTSPLETLSIEHFIEFPEWIAAQGYARLSINVYASSVKGFMDWLVIHDVISPDYKHGVRIAKAFQDLYKKRESKLIRFPKKDDIDNMRHAVYKTQDQSPIKERNIALIEFLASSGCRNSEATNLRVADIDLKEHSAIVTGKGSKERRVFFSSSAAEAIKTYWNIRKFSNPTDYAFCRHDRGTGKKHQKMTTTTTRRVIKLVATLAGIDLKKISPHYFRHDFAIKMLRETGNLALVQDLMGHSSPSSTRVYAKIYPDELQKAHHELYG